MYRWTS